ncbi:MAG: cytochrome P450 [Gammaproteobacteria bacterium]|nr:cytochrome P450 [Gammaproteobacteria bacterium]
MVETAIYTSSPELDDELVKSQNWGNEDWVHAQFQWLRIHDPIRKIEPQGYDPFWSLTRFEDILNVEQDKETFINDPRPILAPKLLEVLIEQMVGRRHLVRSLITMDAPDHLQYRAVAQPWFMRGNLRKIEDTVNRLAVMYVNRLQELGGECDFVKDIAIWYPIRVIMSILGVPESDEPLMMKLTQELFGSADPDTRRSFEQTALMDVVEDFNKYFRELTEARRKDPTDDVASVIANSRINGETMPELETNGYYTIIATAGHDTTSSSISGGLLALIQNPEQFQLLAREPVRFMETAVDEMIRWVTPVRQFMRTATRDAKVGGTDILAGDSCVLWYPSANRDESVYDDPFEFRVDRHETKHLAFGYGVHVCLGQHLARMELSAFFKEFLRRVKHVELNGEPKYSQSVFVGGLKSLPIRYQFE